MGEGLAAMFLAPVELPPETYSVLPSGDQARPSHVVLSFGAEERSVLPCFAAAGCDPWFRAFIGLIGWRVFRRWGWASWGETFKRFLPHTPSSNALAAPAPSAGVGIRAPVAQHGVSTPIRPPLVTASCLGVSVRLRIGILHRTAIGKCSPAPVIAGPWLHVSRRQ